WSEVRGARRDQKIDHARHQVEPKRRDVSDTSAFQEFECQPTGTSEQVAEGGGEAAIPAGELSDRVDGELTQARVGWNIALPARRAERARQLRAAVETAYRVPVDEGRSLEESGFVTHRVRLAVIRAGCNHASLRGQTRITLNGLYIKLAPTPT